MLPNASNEDHNESSNIRHGSRVSEYSLKALSGSFESSDTESMGSNYYD